MVGTVYIASMNMRGAWATQPNNTLKLNVTSAQSLNSLDRKDFSPMTKINGGYKGYWNFETYWQAGKIYSSIPKVKTKKYWKELKEPKRRYPGSKGMKVLYAEFDDYPNEQMDYVTSRKKVYVPEYFNLVKNRERAKHWKKIIENGHDVVIYDFDGPRDENGKPICLQVDKEMLIKKINDVTFPFGHGYVIAAYLAGLEPKDYI